jgi:hypothetical protein
LIDFISIKLITCGHTLVSRGFRSPKNRPPEHRH